MRYDSEHKARTHARLLKEAAATIRAVGPDGIGVAGLMAKAGLTHGGFYAHFKSKDDLVAQAITRMFDDSRALFEARIEGRAPADGLAAMLARLKGIGPETAAVLWTEGLFRQFDNRRQVAAYAGLAPTPWQSGSIDHEQGVSKAGNPRLRTTMVELAWLWLQNQPSSALSLWLHERVRRFGGRMRKTTILALARKLLIALWRYTTAGVVIEGAVMKPATATI